MRRLELARINKTSSRHELLNSLISQINRDCSGQKGIENLLRNVAHVIEAVFVSNVEHVATEQLQLAAKPGAVPRSSDCHIAQPFPTRTIDVKIPRQHAGQAGCHGESLAVEGAPFRHVIP